MGKKISIQIPEPCHEDWNQMSPQERGRHCQVCEKTVMDFTNKTDAFIVKALKSDSNLCGRFRNDQLNRPMEFNTGGYSLIPPLAAGFILPLAILASTSAYSQGEPLPISTKSYVSLNIGSQQQDYKDIKGVVKDTAGNPLPGVRGTIVETNDQIQTDSNGTYRLRARVGHTLRFTYYLHLTEEIQVHPDQDLYNFTLVYNPQHMPEVVVCATGIKRESMILGRIAPEPVVEKPVDSTAVITFKGTVLDDTGLPLPGVNILVKGTDKGIQSDFDGNFEIEAIEGQKLVLSYVGFVTQEVTVMEQKKTIEMQLDTEIEELYQYITVGIPIWHEPSRPVDFRSSYNPSTNFNGNPQLQRDRARYENTVAFQRLQQEQRRAQRKARKKRK